MVLAQPTPSPLPWQRKRGKSISAGRTWRIARGLFIATALAGYAGSQALFEGGIDRGEKSALYERVVVGKENNSLPRIGLHILNDMDKPEWQSQRIIIRAKELKAVVPDSLPDMI